MLTKIQLKLEELGIPQEIIKERALSLCCEAEELVLAELALNGREHLLTPAAAQAWHTLREAASDDDIQLYIVSAFRSIDRQAEIIQRKLDAGLSLTDILDVSAPPGYSEHHTGRAIDIGTPNSPVLEVEFENTAAYAWLSKYAHTFGFTLSYPRNNPLGYAFEPWHWCFQESEETQPLLV